KLFLASGNPHKIKELREILASLEINLQSTLDLREKADVEEDQQTLEGNALKKARFWFRKTGLPSLADDTGLEVSVLEGEPGVYSARYAGPDATYEDNVQKLLEEMGDAKNRKAKFRTVIALVGEEEVLFEGECKGTITKKPRGEKGFGYDPVFLPDGYEQTFAELSSQAKNKISHRGRALQKLLTFLKEKEI
ncbi:MAG: RdgB/HAM1 family non-canonical purine NTP pyrophosphatase, partial [Balneolaceae bacterium]